MTWYSSGFGIGDAIRTACVLWQRYQDGETIGVRVEAEPYDGAAQVYETCEFVSAVERTPLGQAQNQLPEYWASLGCPYHLCRVEAPSARSVRTPLSLPVGQLKIGHSFDLPAQYVAVQPMTTFNKVRYLPPIPFDLPVVLLGAGGEVSGWPGGIDLTGRTTVAEALSVVAGATAAVGVESWVVLAAAAFGKLAWQQVSVAAFDELVPTWDVQFPTLGYRVCK